MIAPPSPAARIRERALALGFDAVGIAGVAPLEAVAHYEAWLAAGHHGGMSWLADDDHRARRADPALVCPGLRAVVCVALCHDPARDDARDARLGRIARYAAGGDYHALMKEKLGALERFVAAEVFPGSRPLWYADTGAILERGWAERAGLGWIGKHSGLLSESLGSWFVLGELLLDREVETDAPLAHERCGTCARCVDACPTRAIVAPYRVDARLCISYLTIEHRGPIPRELRPLVGDWIFGCDLCQDACPWNRFAPPAREARLRAHALEGWSLERFLELDGEGFAALFAESPIRRARREGFLRNVCVALGNRGRADAAGAGARAAGPLALALERDPAALVRSHAAWALGEIARGGGASSGIESALRLTAEYDASPGVREEARLALSASGQEPGSSLRPSTQSSPPSA